VPGEILTGDLMVLDLIYDNTKLLQAAQAAGAATSDGELMLLHQGAAAFQLWSGQDAPLDVMQDALEKARKQGLRSAEGEPTGAAAAGDLAPEAG
jgi:shikimate dehydrogenase